MAFFVFERLALGSTNTNAQVVSGGNIVGVYQDPSTGNTYGYLYQQSVPEPSGLVLLLIGFGTTAGYLVRRQRAVMARPGA